MCEAHRGRIDRGSIRYGLNPVRSESVVRSVANGHPSRPASLRKARHYRDLLPRAGKALAVVPTNRIPMLSTLLLAVAPLALDAADRVISRLPAPDADNFPAWNDWMVVQIARREAEELVKQEAK